jgi:hypothetical protein
LRIATLSTLRPSFGHRLTDGIPGVPRQTLSQSPARVFRVEVRVIVTKHFPWEEMPH